MAAPETEVENIAARLINHVAGPDDALMSRLKVLGKLLDGCSAGVLQAAEEQVIHKWSFETATELVNKTSLASSTPSK